MAMRWIESQLRESWDPRDHERADLIAAMLKARVDDIPLPSEEAAIQASFDAERLVRQQYKSAIREYKLNPHTPEFLTTTWQAVHKYWFKSLDISMTEIPPCDRTLEEIQELEKKRRIMLYIPEELYQWGNGYFLDIRRADAEARDYVGKFEDKYKLHGWLDIDAAVEVPNRGTSVEELQKAIEAEGRIGATVNLYVICSNFTKEVSGYRLDEKGTRSRLLGTTVGSQPVVFYHESNESTPFGVEYSSDPKEKNPKLGGRSVGIKQAV